MRRWYEDTRLKACDWKKFYPDRATAETMARLKGLTPYLCPTCKLFHLTTPKRRAR